MRASSQQTSRSLPGSLPIGLTSSGYRSLWQETGSLNSKGEFKQWLHIFCLEYQQEVPSIKVSRVLPWLNLMPAPCLETLNAMKHMTAFVQYPEEWHRNWPLFITDVSQASDRRSNVCFGPYWMLLPMPGLQFLAQEMVSLKRRIQNEMFRDAEPWSSSRFAVRIAESMEPFLIYPMENT